MNGKYQIIVQNQKIKYDFEIKRNLTIIRGDSATGKTQLVDMIREFDQNGADSGIELVCEKRCTVLEGKSWKTILSSIQKSIVFIDEGNVFVSSREFATAIQNTDNYYVIVTRESLPMLPYSVQEIYGIRRSQKYGGLKQVFNEVFNLYGSVEFTNDITPDAVIVEDSGSGYEFFLCICKKADIQCVTAEGKSNVLSKIIESAKYKSVLVVADGAAFGSEIEKVVSFTLLNNNIHLYLPESFEWLLLKSNLLKDDSVKKILLAPENFIDSEIYFSWERYFADLLIQKTKGTYLQYSKSQLSDAYMTENIQRIILSIMKHITLL